MRISARGVIALIIVAACPWEQAGAAEVEVGLYEHSGDAEVSVEALGPYRVAVRVDPKGWEEPLTIRVDLPETGRGVWPAEDVRVTDAQGAAIPVRRNGIEWHRLFIPVAPEPGTYIVEVVDPRQGKPGPRLPSEADRNAADPDTGIKATICRWFDGRKTALSLRFDDSHPTHLTKAIPILREYGFRGTFMINPGSPDYRARRQDWEACARRDDQEFANHTMYHRGVDSDEEVDEAVGDASKCIWGLFPHRSRLVALNRGGGTTWVTKRPFRYYLDKYNLFIKGGSLGMDDVYGDRVAAFRLHLERHVDRGLWCRAHFHSIGDGLASTEANFRAAMGVAKGHEGELWIAGMADIYKYETQRRGAKLALESNGADGVTLTVSCVTDAELFDQPLTIEVTLPEQWWPEEVVVRDGAERVVPARSVGGSGGAVRRFEVAPVDGAYTIEMPE